MLRRARAALACWRAATRWLLHLVGPGLWGEIRQDLSHLDQALHVQEVAGRPAVGRLVFDGWANALRDLFGRSRRDVPAAGQVRLVYHEGGSDQAHGLPPRLLRNWFQRFAPVLAAAARQVYANNDTPLREKLRTAANVVFAGPKAAQDVPPYLRAMDVCLIPYRAGSQAQAIDPLKLYEYLAFGKPVVTVDIPSVRPFAEVIYVARGREEFLGLLDAAAAERNDEKMARRRALAAENTWEARAEAISRLLEETLRRRTAPRPLEEAAASGR